MMKKLKNALPYILGVLFFIVVLYRIPILEFTKFWHGAVSVQVSELDIYMGIVSGGIAIFSLWALVMTVFSISKLSDIKKTRDKVKKINKGMLWQHMLQLNYAGKHWSETILLCRQILGDHSNYINSKVSLYVRDTLIKSYIEVYSKLEEKPSGIPEEDERYKDSLRHDIHNEIDKELKECERLPKKQKDPTIKNLQADIYFEKGCFEGLCGEYEDSIIDIKTAINMNNKSPNYYSNLAVSQCLTQKDNYVEEAVQNLKKALKLSKDHPRDAWFYNKANILDAFDNRQWEKLDERIKEKLLEAICDGIDYRSKKMAEKENNK